MENSGVEQSLVGEEKVVSPADLEERNVLEEKLCCTRLELQKTLSLSADADETICKLATVARRMVQERDEARNQGKMLLAELQARHAQMMLTGRAYSRIARPDSFAITGYNRALVPTAVKPFSGMMMMMQERYAQTGTSYCSASSHNDLGGHRNLAFSLNINPAQPSSHDFTSPSQDSFDPDMFLVDAAESPQDFVAASASPDLGKRKNSGAFDLAAEKMPLSRKGKVAHAACDAGPLVRPVTDAGGSIKVCPSFTEQCCSGGHSLVDVVNSAGNSRRTS